ncbi:MAG TPA: hypothetical protein VNO33_08925 [Kofleriaceae bacterium]|nr:hypothetical protein [Kofleriaceae bacterium]
MRSRAWLFGLVAVAVGVAVVLLLWPRSTSHEVPAEHQPPTTEGAAATPRDPALPDDVEDDARAKAVEKGVRDRRGEVGTMPRRRLPGDPATYPIQQPVIAELRAALRPQIKKCSDEHASGMGPRAQIMGSLRVAVHSGVVSVVEVKVDHRDMPETSPVIECARKAFASAQLRAEGHDDVEGHLVRLPFRMPVK